MSITSEAWGMSHYIKALQQVSLFDGAISLSVDDRILLQDAQFEHVDVQDAITAGQVVEITAEEAIKFHGAYPVTNTDRQLTKNENISVDTTLGMVRVSVYPRPRSGYAHYIMPAKLTWETNHVRLPVSNPAYPIMGQVDWYDLDISAGVYILYVDDVIGWRVTPS